MKRTILAELVLTGPISIWSVVHWAAQRAALFGWREVTIAHPLGRVITVSDQ